MPRARRAEALAETPLSLEVVPRRGLRREEAARYVGISTSKFDACVKDGRMPRPFRIDGCVIWDVQRLDSAIVALSEAPDVAADDVWSHVVV